MTRYLSSRKGMTRVVVGLLILILIIILYLLIFDKTSSLAFGPLSTILGRNSPDTYMELGMRAYQDSDYKNAVGNYKDMLKRYPNHERAKEAQLRLALSYSAQKSYFLAADHFERLYDMPGLSEKESNMINEMASYYNDKSRDDSLTWNCCDFYSLGSVWTYGSCSNINDDTILCGTKPDSP